MKDSGTPRRREGSPDQDRPTDGSSRSPASDDAGGHPTSASQAQRSARELAEGQGPRATFLSSAARLLAGSLDYETTLASVAGLALPDLGSWCIVDVVESDDSIRRLAIVHPDPKKERIARELQRNWPPTTEDPIGAPVVMRTRQSQVVTDVSDEMLVRVARDEANLRLLRELGIGSFLAVPLIARGKVLGAMTFIASNIGHQYTERDLGLAEDLASLAALAIENSQLHRSIRQALTRAEHRAEEAERQRKDLENLTESQARLVRGFSHDVKNPLGAAAGHVQLLEEGVLAGLTPKQLESVNRIGNSIRSALELIDDLVEYAKSRLGEVEVRRGRTSPAEVVAEIAEEHSAQIEAAGLELELDLPEHLPVLWTDRARIRQILGNLISNAVKYTAKGRITLRAGTRKDGAGPAPGEWVLIEVEDTGRGIPEEQQHLLFREFTRLEPETGTGAGLGLAISKRIADALGGDISLQSQAGRGSTFGLWLPLVAEEQDPAGDATASPSVRRA